VERRYVLKARIIKVARLTNVVSPLSNKERKKEAHQQTSERAAPPVSVEEKGKTTGDEIKLLLFLLMSIHN
jgi:hypothetical protein